MIAMMYLYTEPYTCYFYKENQILLYNTLDKKAVKMEVDETLRSIAEELVKEKIVPIHDDVLKYPSISHFIHILRDSFNGDVLSIADGQVIPAIFHPIINNQRAFERLMKVDKINIDNQVMNYLEEVYVYVNGNGGKEAYPSFLQVPSYMYQTENIDGNSLVNWLDSIHDKQINQLNLLGGDVLTHPYYNEIFKVAKQKSHEIILHYRYDLFKAEYIQVLDEIDKLVLIIPMHFVSETVLKEKVSALQDCLNIQWLFLINSEDEYLHAEALCEQYRIDNYMFKPIFNGKNLSFFEDFIFMDETEILGLQPTKREIYANQTINRNEFGRITVLPNGDIYANPNKNRLGTIYEDRMHDIIFKEMNEGASWLNIRKEQPCCGCIYQWLCPSPSHYEDVIGKPNLCHVKHLNKGTI